MHSIKSLYIFNPIKPLNPTIFLFISSLNHFKDIHIKSVYTFHLYTCGIQKKVRSRCSVDQAPDLKVNKSLHDLCELLEKEHSTTVIAKIKGMPRSLFYDTPCYVAIDYDKWYTSFLLKRSVHLFKIMSISCRFHVSAVVLILYISY